MSVPLHRLKKDDLIWRATHYCTAHRHSFLDHPNCYEREHPDRERLGFFDIEASNLSADFGIILSYAIKPLGSDNIYSDVITKRDIDRAKAGDEDKKIVQNLIRDLANFDRVVTYYGSRFDIPYIRTRAVSTGVDFPNYGTLKHTDLYYVIKHRLKLSSNRLENAARVVLGDSEKTRVDAKYWRGGQRGDKAALDYILDHNLKDVRDLEKLYLKVINFSRKNDVSI